MELPAGTRLFAVLTFGNLIGVLNDKFPDFATDDDGTSILISCFRNGELIPIGIDEEFVVKADDDAPVSFFFAKIAAVSRSFPPPFYKLKLINYNYNQ